MQQKGLMQVDKEAEFEPKVKPEFDDEYTKKYYIDHTDPEMKLVMTSEMTDVQFQMFEARHIRREEIKNATNILIGKSLEEMMKRKKKQENKPLNQDVTLEELMRPKNAKTSAHILDDDEILM